MMHWFSLLLLLFLPFPFPPLPSLGCGCRDRGMSFHQRIGQKEKGKDLSLSAQSVESHTSYNIAGAAIWTRAAVPPSHFPYRISTQYCVGESALEDGGGFVQSDGRGGGGKKFPLFEKGSCLHPWTDRPHIAQKILSHTHPTDLRTNLLAFEKEEAPLFNSALEEGRETFLLPFPSQTERGREKKGRAEMKFHLFYFPLFSIFLVKPPSLSLPPFLLF